MDFDSKLEVAYQSGRQAWPAIGLGRERFADCARQAGVAPEDLTARAADLFLAYACAQRDPAALQRFEATILSRVDVYVGNLTMSSLSLDEIRQRVRVKLLTGDPPAIAWYRGRGPLGAWVRVTTVRLALNLLAEADVATSSDADLLEMTAPLDDSPDLAAARRLYRQRFQAALEAALSGLSARDKTLLRLHVIEALNVDAIGKIYRVHRATAARWLVAIRSRIFQSLRKDLGLQRMASSSEVRSLAGLLRDEIHLSTRRILNAGIAD
jgi:RNA polymerase sigma-70 factor (ECF subfamily)